MCVSACVCFSVLECVCSYPCGCMKTFCFAPAQCLLSAGGISLMWHRRPRVDWNKLFLFDSIFRTLSTDTCTFDIPASSLPGLAEWQNGINGAQNRLFFNTTLLPSLQCTSTTFGTAIFRVVCCSIATPNCCLLACFPPSCQCAFIVPNINCILHHFRVILGSAIESRSIHSRECTHFPVLTVVFHRTPTQSVTLAECTQSQRGTVMHTMRTTIIE